MLKLNGNDIPTPSAFQVGLMDITKAERNAKGDMIIEKITTKRKLEISYNYLTKTELTDLLNKINASITFTVNYPDPLTGNLRTGTFYSGDRSVEMIDYINSVPRYKGISFNFIEV